MIRARILAGLVLALAAQTDARAQDTSAIRAVNALNDMARAQRHQAENLRRLESVERDRARAADTARHNAERDSRSLRRFDRP